MVQGPEQQKLFGPAVAIAPMNRMGEPEEIADACLFLCSSKATFVQGASLVSISNDDVNVEQRGLIEKGCGWRLYDQLSVYMCGNFSVLGNGYPFISQGHLITDKNFRKSRALQL